jgi:hypothetical protein
MSGGCVSGAGHSACPAGFSLDDLAHSKRVDKGDGVAARSVAMGVVGIALVGAAVTGCGGGGKSSNAISDAASSASSAAAAAAKNIPGGTGGPDPCTLLTDGEASQWLGATATHGPAKSQFRGKDCKWTADGNFLLLQVYDGKSFYSPKELAPGGTSVSGVGDSAFTSEALAGAIKGNTVVIIGGTGSANAHFTDALRAAMGRV